MWASLWGTQDWAPCPPTAGRPGQPGWSAVLAESREGSAANPNGPTTASSEHLAGWPGDGQLMSWNPGLPPSLPPSSSPPGAARGGGEGQGAGPGSTKALVIFKTAQWIRFQEEGERRGAEGPGPPASCPLSFPRCRAERERGDFCSAAEHFHQLWNFPAQLLSPPAPSSPTGRGGKA